MFSSLQVPVCDVWHVHPPQPSLLPSAPQLVGFPRLLLRRLAAPQAGVGLGLGPQRLPPAEQAEPAARRQIQVRRGWDGDLNKINENIFLKALAVNEM